MSNDNKAQALAEVAAAADAFAEMRERRRRAIRKARRAGGTFRQIAAEALLSHEHVRRICAEQYPMNRRADARRGRLAAATRR